MSTPARFLPTPPPQNIPVELQEWLREEMERIALAMNSSFNIIDDDALINNFGLLDGALPSISIPDTPDFVPAINYPDSLAQGEFTVDPVAGTITIPNIAGWLEITLFFSMKQIDNEKDFTVVVHLEIDGTPISFSSGSGYIPSQERDLELTISTVKTRPTIGGETFRLVFQVLDENNVNFDIKDSTFKIKYIQVNR